MIDARPRSASEIIDSSFNILRQNYGDFVTAAAVMYLPMLAVQLFYPPDRSSPAMFSTTAVIARVVFPILWGNLINAAISVLTAQIFRGEALDIRAAIERTLRRFIPITVVAVLLYVVASLALILFIIPAFLVFARWGVSVTIVAVEPTGITESFSRASRLSENNRMHYFKTLLIIIVLYTIAAITLSGLSEVGNALLHTTSFAIVAGALLGIFLQPVMGIVQALLYFDMRIRNEGYDLQLMSEQLEADPAPAVAPAS
jgi:hypothetical protein